MGVTKSYVLHVQSSMYGALSKQEVHKASETIDIWLRMTLKNET